MADSGIRHVVSTIPVPQSEFEDEAFHALEHGNSFPGAPDERQLYYRDDTHKLYWYNGTNWIDSTGAAASDLGDVADVNIPAPANNDLIVYDGVAGEWIALSIGDLADHHARHENGGADEISVAHLSGLLADDQHVIDAEAVDAMGALADGNPLNHDKYTDANAVAAIKADGNFPLTTITFIIDGGGSAIATGQKGHLEIPFACTITRVTMMADVSGSIVVDIWKDTYANFPPDNADSITAAAPPTITTAQKSQDATLTDWTTAIAAGDILAFNVDSCTTITRVTISLKVEKT